MPADDMYSDGPPGASAPSAPPEDAEPKESDETDTGQTGLLSKSVLGEDLKPGHVCEVEIVADHGDDYEVKYVTKGEEEPEKSGNSDGEAPAKADGGMESMLQD